MKQFVAILDTPGGHVCACFALIVMGAALHRMGTPKSEDVLPFALGILARSMLGQNGRGAGVTEGNPKP